MVSAGWRKFWAALALPGVLMAVSARAQGTEAPAYTVTDLGMLGGGGSVACAINNAGQIVGFSDTPGDEMQHAVLFSVNRAGEVVCLDLGTLGGSNSRALDINDAGQIVGYSQVAGDPANHATLYTINGSTVSRTDLGTLGGKSSYANAINNAGLIVGSSNVAGARDGYNHATLFRVSGSTVARVDLGTLGGLSSGADGINDAGLIVGSAATAGGPTHATLFAVDAGGAVTRTDLGVLPGGVTSYACGVGPAGQIVGSSEVAEADGSSEAAGVDASRHGVLFTVDRVGTVTRTDLGGFGLAGFGATDTTACFVNRLGQIAGYYRLGIYGYSHGFIRAPSGGKLQDINDLVKPGSLVMNYSCWSGRCINDKGQIAATAIVGNKEHAFLLSPVRQAAPRPK